MAGPDNLASLFHPDLIGQFDEIPADTTLNIEIKKGELAYFVKSNVQLFQGMWSLIQAVDFTAFTDDAKNSLSHAYQLMNASQQSFDMGAQRPD